MGIHELPARDMCGGVPLLPLTPLLLLDQPQTLLFPDPLFLHPDLFLLDLDQDLVRDHVLVPFIVRELILRRVGIRS